MTCSSCTADLVVGALFCHFCGSLVSKSDGGDTKQENNAGNNGDRVKHAVVLHILERAAQWGEVRYRETHAGAGFYPMNDESRELRGLVLKRQPPSDTDRAGAYFWSLRSWWEADSPGYPGAIVQAVKWLRCRREQGNFEFDVRATENAPRSFASLAAIAASYSLEVRGRSFSDQVTLDWLLDGDNLVVLLDPFRYVRVRGDEQPGVQKGYLDRDALWRVLDACAKKRRAVVHIWASKGHDGYQSSLAHLRQDVTAWVKAHGQATSCQYRCGNYGISVVGINDGRTAVEAPPDVASWKRSWLSQPPLSPINAADLD